jgi:hypothetical protein
VDTVVVAAAELVQWGVMEPELRLLTPLEVPAGLVLPLQSQVHLFFLAVAVAVDATQMLRLPVVVTEAAVTGEPTALVGEQMPRRELLTLAVVEAVHKVPRLSVLQEVLELLFYLYQHQTTQALQLAPQRSQHPAQTQLSNSTHLAHTQLNRN